MKSVGYLLVLFFQKTAAILLLAAAATARPSDHWEPESQSHSEHSKPYHVTVIKKIGVPIPHPVAISVPQYVKIPIPQPYPVHVTVEQPIHVPVYKVCFLYWEYITKPTSVILRCWAGWGKISLGNNAQYTPMRVVSADLYPILDKILDFLSRQKVNA